MSFMQPKSKAVASNVNQKVLTDTYTPQAQQGITGGNYLTALLTGQGDVGAANAGYDNYKAMTGYEPAMRNLSNSIVGGGAASGLLRSGSTAKALTKYGAELDQGFYNNYLQQLAGLSQMGQGAGQLIQGAGSGDVITKPSMFSSIMSGVGGIASMFSDRRLKDDITLVGEYPNGLPKYEFRYKGQHQKWSGVMADDVEKVRPDLVGESLDGFKTVNYGALGIRMEQV